VNDADALSVQVGNYYQNARHIPPANVIHVRFAPGRTHLSKIEFQKLKTNIDRLTPPHVQAYALAWTIPYRVDCMSITSALAFGYSEHYCSRQCGATQASAYFNSGSHFPAQELNLRPAMLLAGNSFAQVKQLIDRGIASDHTFPAGRAYLLNTPDKLRSVRSVYFAQTAKDLADTFSFEVLNTTAIANRQDVLFYFTGLVQVPQLETLHFVPGALADHLTSLGGQLTDSTQMSSLRWLEAGATASYGAVVEPCNHLQKFPFPAIAMYFYAQGASAIEAYWKSVAWPGEGVFIGEPLAQPFAPKLRELEAGQFELTLYSAKSGLLRLGHSASRAEVFNPVSEQSIQPGINVIRFSTFVTTDPFLRVEWQ
jgi:uncharacterized protein (TIGR03790 family)